MRGGEYYHFQECNSRNLHSLEIVRTETRALIPVHKQVNGMQVILARPGLGLKEGLVLGPIKLVYLISIHSLDVVLEDEPVQSLRGIHGEVLWLLGSFSLLVVVQILAAQPRNAICNF